MDRSAHLAFNGLNVDRDGVIYHYKGIKDRWKSAAEVGR
jgi:hypothetical protein